MKVGIAADHGGYQMKEKIHILLGTRGHQVVDFGNLQYDRDDDYTDFAVPLARAVAEGVVDRDVLLCGSGIGTSIAANQIDGVRNSAMMIFRPAVFLLRSSRAPIARSSSG